MSFEARLAELKITLPPAPKPVATYVPAVRAGDLLFLSGTGPFKDGAIAFAGKLGKDLTVEQGSEAARLTLLNALAMVRQELVTLFFFQAEDGIRDLTVTGVQTCALPI